MDQWAGVVLAAGDGKRMKSRLTKVLHRVCGKELVRYPVDLMKESGVSRVVVVVSPGNRQAVQELLGNQVEYVTQTEVKGTGDALSKAKVLLQGQAENVLVLTGDAPLVRQESVKPLMSAHADSSREMTFLTCPQHWSCSVVVWSRDIHGSTMRVEPLDDLEMTILTRDEHWSCSRVLWSRDIQCSTFPKECSRQLNITQMGSAARLRVQLPGSYLNDLGLGSRS